MDLGQFFAMGGYGGYVWGAYGISAIVLILNIVLPLRARRAAIRRVRAAQQEHPATAVKRGTQKKSVRKKS